LPRTSCETRTNIPEDANLDAKWLLPEPGIPTRIITKGRTVLPFPSAMMLNQHCTEMKGTEMRMENNEQSVHVMINRIGKVREIIHEET
jgi:hypothetical protein